MERQARSRLNTQIYEEACEWFVEFRGGDMDTSARRLFDFWLRKSPEHLSAYLEIAAIWNEWPSFDPKQKWNAATLIAHAAKDRENVVLLAHLSSSDTSTGTSICASGRSGEHLHINESSPFDPLNAKWTEEHSAPGSEAEVKPSGFAPRPVRQLRIAASIVTFSLVLGALLWTQLFGAPTYATAVGEQRSIVLPDGSTIELNSRSKITVQYSQEARAVDLLEGQALFHVAKDHARPFIVRSDGTRVRAVGTQFDVYKKNGGTIVTVVEGRVAILINRDRETVAASVDPDPSPSALSSLSDDEDQRTSILLSAGEQLIVSQNTVRKADHPNMASATAWTQRQLVFESESLSDVAEEFNRYNERQLVIEDPKLYDFHISGVFSSTDPQSLIRFLRERPGVHVIETASEIRVVRNIS
jgi:transmembrane sensor